MSNDYFARQFNAQPDTLARSGDVRSEFGSVETAFEKLPAPHPTLKGFNEPIVVPTPVAAEHAAPKSFIEAFVQSGLLFATSTSSVVMGVGSKGFAILESAARSWVVGTELKIVSAADRTKYMLGVVTAYAHPNVTIDVTYATAAGTINAWIIAPTTITPFSRWPSGTAANPGLANDGQPTTGFYAELGLIGVAIGGVARWTQTATVATFATPVVLPGDPADNSHAARKFYVDVGDASAYALAIAYSEDRLLNAAVTLLNKQHTNPGHTDQTLADGATVNWNMNSGHIATLTLGGNRTIANPTNLKKGSALLFLKQDATGSRAVTWGSAYKWPGGTPPILSTAANAVDVITFVSDGTNLYGNILRGFA